jgi:hypothetical protein
VKKRGSSHTLFAKDEPVQYLVDTSSWIALNERPDLQIIFPVINALIAAERLFSPAVVIEESRSAAALMEPHRSRLTKCDRIDAEFLLLAGRIANKYRRMARPSGRKTKADPFLVALGIIDGYTVVAEESLKRATGKIPGVCAKEHVKCINLAQLIAEETGLAV